MCAHGMIWRCWRHCKSTSDVPSCWGRWLNVIFSINATNGCLLFHFWVSPPWQETAHRTLWTAAITGPWPFRSHTNKEIYDLVQCAIKAHVVIPSTFTARGGYAALLLQVYRRLVEKQLLVFLGGRQEKAEVARDWMREPGLLNVSRYLNVGR